MVYGGHIIATPGRRWCILVSYWVVLSSIVVPRGYLIELYNKDWMPISWLHVASVISSIAIFLSCWDWGAYAFGRQWSLFSTIVYPIGHIIDTLMWYTIFDIGKEWLSFPESSMFTQYLAGHFLLSMFVFGHRKTFEVWYLPEHHPPRHIRGEFYYVIAAIFSSFLLTAIYHWRGDLRWCVLIKYAIDFFCCVRMRLPAPWMPYSDEHMEDKGWDWAGY